MVNRFSRGVVFGGRGNDSVHAEIFDHLAVVVVGMRDPNSARRERVDLLFPGACSMFSVVNVAAAR
jgi:hypothetical protein